jgi:hypothetical protein
MTRRKTEPTHRLPDLLQARHLVEPPRDVLHRAVALGERLRQPVRLADAARWLVELVFDSAREPLPVGVRGGGGAERRLLFEARQGDGASHQVDLRLRRTAAGRIDVTGQCLPPWPGARVEAGSGRHRADLGEGGEFLLRGLSARGGGLKLVLRLPGKGDLELLDVPLPEEPGPQ